VADDVARLEDDPTGERDPGLQPERTSLAWARTVLGYLVVATIGLKMAPLSGTTAVASALAYLGVAVVVALRRTPRYREDRRQLRVERSRPPVLEVLTLSAVTAALALHWLWLSA
jgi:uncharacterized membrane protein YidH (DUF202 family)